MIDKYGDNKDKALKFLSFRKIAFNKNNDLIFNAEEEYITSSGSLGAPVGMHSTGNRTYFHYDDIICAKLNSQGDLLWARNINKSQSNDVNEDSYISYASMQKEESSYLFINTGEKINKLKNDRIEFNQVRRNKSNLNIIRINSNGDFDFEEILDDENSEVPFMVSKGTSINDAIYFLGRRGKNKQLLKITL